MAKYRKKPIVIDGFQFWPQHDIWPEGVEEIRLEGDTVVYRIQTIDGYAFVSPGDYVLIGTRGEKYPCKSDCLRDSYEEVKERNILSNLIYSVVFMLKHSIRK